MIDAKSAPADQQSRVRVKGDRIFDGRYGQRHQYRTEGAPGFYLSGKARGGVWSASSCAKPIRVPVNPRGPHTCTRSSRPELWLAHLSLYVSVKLPPPGLVPWSET